MQSRSCLQVFSWLHWCSAYEQDITILATLVGQRNSSDRCNRATKPCESSQAVLLADKKWHVIRDSAKKRYVILCRVPANSDPRRQATKFAYVCISARATAAAKWKRHGYCSRLKQKAVLPLAGRFGRFPLFGSSVHLNKRRLGVPLPVGWVLSHLLPWRTFPLETLRIAPVGVVPACRRRRPRPPAISLTVPPAVSVVPIPCTLTLTLTLPAVTLCSGGRASSSCTSRPWMRQVKLLEACGDLILNGNCDAQDIYFRHRTILTAGGRPRQKFVHHRIPH